jgi:hypothetical protein
MSDCDDDTDRCRAHLRGRWELARAAGRFVPNSRALIWTASSGGKVGLLGLRLAGSGTLVCRSLSLAVIAGAVASRNRGHGLLGGRYSDDNPHSRPWTLKPGIPSTRRPDILEPKYHGIAVSTKLHPAQIGRTRKPEINTAGSQATGFAATPATRCGSPGVRTEVPLNDSKFSPTSGSELPRASRGIRPR